MSCSNAPVSPRPTSCMSRKSSASSSDFARFPRSLPGIGHLDVRTRQGLQEKWQLDKFTLHYIRSHGFCCKPQAACACLAAEALPSTPRMNYQLIPQELDRKSTRLNSSHQIISYA